MNPNFVWHKGFFDSNYQIFKDGNISYSLIFDTWQNTAKGIGLQNTYLFKTLSILDTKTQLIDNKGEVLGTITINILQTKAVITLTNGEIFYFEFKGTWFNAWTITDLKQKQIFYQSNSTSGEITSNNEDELMLLSGLFIKEFYTRIFIAFLLFIVFIPIIFRNF